MNAPRISFVMAAFDAAPYVEAAIRSALGQTGLAVEVIVVDDASRDDTAARVAALAASDPRVRLLRRACGGGPSAARNLAIAQARGDWIAILDADDLVEPERGARLVALAEESGCAVAADNALRFLDADPAVAWPLLPRRRPDEIRRFGVSEYLRRNRMMRGDGNLGYLKPIFSRAFLTAHGIAYDERLRIGEDFNFCLRCLAAGAELVVTTEPLYRYRVLRGSLSRRLERRDVAAMLAAHADVHGMSRDRRVRDADRRYRRSLADAIVYIDFRSALRQRDWAGTIALSRRPRLWLTVAEVAWSAAKRRLAGRGLRAATT
ncbi:glycosyltransferase family 2 protein [Methylobacterium nigriterrae]|uniref:glycosyltransferase family 2 protein n=1 Tax=Methylobacterium nigriterrae TaxID=3127512 RepID=UPI003013220B